MNILVKDTPIKVSVDFQTTKAPCEGCRFFQPSGATAGAPAICTVENKALSSAVIDECKKSNWRRE